MINTHTVDRGTKMSGGVRRWRPLKHVAQHETPLSVYTLAFLWVQDWIRLCARHSGNASKS